MSKVKTFVSELPMYFEYFVWRFFEELIDGAFFILAAAFVFLAFDGLREAFAFVGWMALFTAVMVGYETFFLTETVCDDEEDEVQESA